MSTNIMINIDSSFEDIIKPLNFTNVRYVQQQMPRYAMKQLTNLIILNVIQKQQFDYMIVNNLDIELYDNVVNYNFSVNDYIQHNFMQDYQSITDVIKANVLIVNIDEEPYYLIDQLLKQGNQVSLLKFDFIKDVELIDKQYFMQVDLQKDSFILDNVKKYRQFKQQLNSFGQRFVKRTNLFEIKLPWMVVYLYNVCFVDFCEFVKSLDSISALRYDINKNCYIYNCDCKNEPITVELTDTFIRNIIDFKNYSVSMLIQQVNIPIDIAEIIIKELRDLIENDIKRIN